jgi:DNA repair protein SbcD/Mre11
MKFAHLADCHIGGWRDPKLNDISIQSFEKTIDACIEQHVDFILIAGDLFNTAYPGIEALKTATKKLKEVKDSGIRTYLIAGSHDFSPTGKTMLDVLEHAGLAKNVTRGEIINDKLKLHFTIDGPTGAKITGILGKKGQLDKKYYQNLLREDLEKEEGFKIFMFHTTITELKPKEMERVDSTEITFLPKNFNYYAGGHVHIVKNFSLENYKNVIYPGPTFPNSFSELEKLKQGGLYFYEKKEGEEEKITYHPIKIKETETIQISCNNKEPKEIEQEIEQALTKRDVQDKIVTLRIEGKLASGKRSDINFKAITTIAAEKGCYMLLKNTNKLESDTFEEIKIHVDDNNNIEQQIIREHLNQIKMKNLTETKEKELIHNLIQTLQEAKKEGETKNEHEDRTKNNVKLLLKQII